MYNPKLLREPLASLFGWRQYPDTAKLKIADSLTVSETEQYYQDLHPLLTLDNLYSVADKKTRIIRPDWSALTTYKKGEWVKVGEVDYRALQASLDKNPETETAYWEVFDSFSEWLEQKTQAAAMEAVRTIWIEKIKEKTAANILESKTLFNGAGRITETVENSTNYLVGFEIVPIRAKGVQTKIEKIGLQFTGVGQTTLYLFHSSQKDPIKTISLTRTKNASMEWFSVADLYLPYESENNDAGGSWYLMYRQSDLPADVKAINKTKDWSGKPCSTCDRDELTSFNVWSKYLEIHPLRVLQPDNEMWDVEDNVYTFLNNYGINLSITLECDTTDLLLQNKLAFQNVIGLQVAANLLREIAYNSNFSINRASLTFSRQEILYELDGDSQGVKKSGLGYQLQLAKEAVKIDMKPLSRVCYRCGDKGIIIGTV